MEEGEKMARMGHHNRKGMNGKKVKMYDLDTNEFVGEYESVADAAYDNFTNTQTIFHALKVNGGKMKYKGCRFEYAE